MTADRKAKQLAILEQLAREVEQEELQEKEARDLNTVEEDTQVPEEFTEAVPDAWGEDKRLELKAERQAEEDSYLKKLNIVSVYKKLTGNNVKLSGGENEKLVFCPTADHHNSNSEAACINTAKGTWVCYGQCEDGGGVIDMVAAANGVPFGKKLKGTDYAKAKQKTLEDFCGWVFERSGKGWVGKSPEAQQREREEFEAEAGISSENTDEPSPEDVASGLGFSIAAIDDDLPSIGPTSFAKSEFGIKEEDQPEKPAPVVEAPPTSLETKPPRGVEQPRPRLASVPDIEDEYDDFDDVLLPEIDGIWEHLPEGTPLHEYMRVTRDMKVPKEFCLFRGLQLLALSAGPYARGKVGRAFKPTLSVLFVGVTGAGKSQSRWVMNEVLDHIVFKWNASPPTGGLYGEHTGVKKLVEPGSGEYLIDQMSEEVQNGAKFKVRDVMGDLEVDELSRFMAKGMTQGSTLIGVFQELDNDPKLDLVVSAGSRSGGGDTVAINPNVVFSAGVQPSALGRLVGKGNIGNGLLARFEVVTGNKVYGGDPFDSGMKDTDHCQDLYTDVAVYYMNKTEQNGKTVRKLFYINVHDDARDEMRAAAATIERWQRGEDIKSRFDLKLFKIATLFAINRRADFVMKEDIKAAMWVMEYLNRSTTMTGEKVVSTEGNEMEAAILAGISATVASGRTSSEAVVWNRTRGSSKGWDRSAFVKKLNELEERGEIISMMSQGKRGKKTKIYTVHGQAPLKVAKNTTQDRKSK